MKIYNYVLLLRAVNLGPKNRVSMDRLKEICLELGAKYAFTVMNSGNVLLEWNEDKIEVSEKITKGLSEKLGFACEWILLDSSEVKHIAETKLFADLKDEEVAYVTFLAIPDPTLKKTMPKQLAHIHVLQVQDSYLFSVSQLTDDATSFPNLLIEKQVKQSCTSRNFNTILKLAKLVEPA